MNTECYYTINDKKYNFGIFDELIEHILENKFDENYNLVLSKFKKYIFSEYSENYLDHVSYDNVTKFFTISNANIQKMKMSGLVPYQLKTDSCTIKISLNKFIDVIHDFKPDIEEFKFTFNHLGVEAEVDTLTPAIVI